MSALSLQIQTSGGILPVQVSVRHLIIAGWTGRDRTALEAHIRELAALGVAAPVRTPVFYRVSASLLTTEPAIQVLGTDSTGEVEFVLIRDAERLLVGLGSDQTDRKAEAIGVALSKQMCPKPLAADVWELSSVEPHWDELILRSYVVADGSRTVYQEGSVANTLAPEKLLELYTAQSGRPFCTGAAMFCGTLPVIGELRWASEFVMELEDPVLNRKLSHSYAMRPLPVES